MWWKQQMHWHSNGSDIVGNESPCIDSIHKLVFVLFWAFVISFILSFIHSLTHTRRCRSIQSACIFFNGSYSTSTNSHCSHHLRARNVYTLCSIVFFVSFFRISFCYVQIDCYNSFFYILSHRLFDALSILCINDSIVLLTVSIQRAEQFLWVF